MPATREQIQQGIKAVEAEIARRTLPSRVLASTFGPQRAFVEDSARLKAAVCGRRAGKTYGVAAWLVLGALLYPQTHQLYIHLNRMEAKRTIWRTLVEMDKDFGIGGVFKEADLEYHTPNGSLIQVTGCPDATHVHNYRGKAYKRVAIDEAASFPAYLTHLIDGVLMQTLWDHQGDMALIGTPGYTPVGYFWGVATGKQKGWSSSHHWTAEQNTANPQIAIEMEAERVRLGRSKDHPTYQRESLGLWVADTGMLVYHAFSPERSTVDRLPDLGPWHYVLGIDIGASEKVPSTVYALLAYSDRCRTAFVVETVGEAGATPSSIAERVGAYDQLYRLEAIVMDDGGLGGGYIKEIRQRHRIPVEAAEKSNKRGFIELLNGDLQGDGLRLVNSGTTMLQSEMAVLPWADDTKKDEKAGVPNHHCDAALYGWRRCRQYHAVPDGPPPPAPGTAEWMADEERRMSEAIDQEYRRNKNQPWWHRRPGR